VPGALTAAQLVQLQQQRPQGPAAFAALQAAPMRPVGMYGQQGMPGVRPGAPALQGSIAREVSQHLALLKPGEAPRVAAPEGYEWVLCASREGTGAASWYALPRAAAAAHNAQVRGDLCVDGQGGSMIGQQGHQTLAGSRWLCVCMLCVFLLSVCMLCV
jgi:hypothetical protein